MADPLINSTVSHYRILDLIGEGGTGRVYRAEDLRLNRIVALKFLSGTEANDENTRLLTHEAQAAAALNHPHIATIYQLEQEETLSFISRKGRQAD